MPLARTRGGGWSDTGRRNARLALVAHPRHQQGGSWTVHPTGGGPSCSADAIRLASPGRRAGIFRDRPVRRCARASTYPRCGPATTSSSVRCSPRHREPVYPRLRLGSGCAANADAWRSVRSATAGSSRAVLAMRQADDEPGTPQIRFASQVAMDEWKAVVPLLRGAVFTAAVLRLAGGCAGAVLSLLAFTGCGNPTTESALLLENVTVIDGTGAPAQAGMSGTAAVRVAAHPERRYPGGGWDRRRRAVGRGTPWKKGRSCEESRRSSPTCSGRPIVT